MNPLYSYPGPELSIPNFYAVDTETTLIKESTYGFNSRTRISKPDIPDLVLGSVAGEGKVEVYTAADLLNWLECALSDSSTHLIFHNVSFDYFVLLRAGSHLSSLLTQAVDEGRIHDTMIMETLIQIARGSRTV